MPVRSALFVILVAVLAASPAAAESAQDPTVTPPPATGRLRVYLDCFDCFPTYLRDEIKWVDFVRQPQDGDVHLLSTSQATGGGGREIVLRFVGRGRFDGQNQQLRAITLTGDTEDTRRRIVLRTVTVGLLNYIARDGLLGGLNVDVRSPQAGVEDVTAPVDDPWNLWVFRIRATTSYEEQEQSSERRWDVNLSADRVTESWKFGFGARANHRRERFRLDEEDDQDEFESVRRDRSVDFFVARSLGPHWSIGVGGRAASSTFGNTKFSASLLPAVEYSVFPYEEYATRQFVLKYEIGLQSSKYNEVTLFDKIEEQLYRHEIGARLDQRQPWGSLQAGAEFSQYLHDRSKYRLEVNGEIDVRIFRGLSVNFDGNASRIRDQISLPRRSASPEEVLLRLRQLRSGYQFEFSVGVTYSFGSLFNNVVNPRFGG